jgi:hypothetical protein
MTNQKSSFETIGRELVHRILATETVDELENLLVQDEEIRRNIGQPKLALVAYSHMRQLTFDGPIRAKPHILDGLLDWCCKPSDGEDPITSIQSYQFREVLEKWLYQYPFEQYAGIRLALLAKLTESLIHEPSKDKLWTIATIGLRTERVIQVVEGILPSNDEELADAALSVLVGLGVPSDRFNSLLNIVAGKLQHNQLTLGCFHAVQNLSGPSRTELAIELLRVAETLKEEDMNVSWAFSVASKVAGRSPENVELHKSIWEVFSKHGRTLRMTPSYAINCDLQETMNFYLSRLLTDKDSGDKELSAFVWLTQLEGLTNPNQLDFWNVPISRELVTELRQFATLDTKIEGRFSTTILDLKELAWETALIAGVNEVGEWIDTAVLDETNSNAAQSICEIAACVRPSKLSDRFLEALQKEANEDDWMRHLGMIDLARSCSDRRSFDALLNFGLTKDGNVLLSTVHAITDCALTRIREGDSDVVQKVLAQTSPSRAHRHRVAAIDVFCDLAMQKEELVRNALGGDICRLWEFALDNSLDELSRFRAFEAIALSDIEINHAQREQLVNIARNADELGWRSCAALVKRELVTIEDEWLQEKLGLRWSNSKLEIANQHDIADWQAYLIGLMFQRQPEVFASAVSKIVSVSSDQSLYQLFEPLEHLKRECPTNVARGITLRINGSNSRSRTNLELIRILRLVSPPQLLALVKARDWQNWMPVAKSRLCEMVDEIASECLEHRNEGIALLHDFIRDPSYQVRRSAYRGLSKISPEQLRDLAVSWSRTGDVELRKRASESVAWLPRDQYPDQKILDIGLGWDEEPSVRDAFKGTIERRRRLQLSRQYLKTLFHGCLEPNGVLNTYRYARALEQIGDDETASKIDDFLESRCPMLPNVGHYLEKTVKAIRRNWKKETEKWPEPWSYEMCIVETAKGQLLIPGYNPFNATFTLRCRHRKSPSELGEWSATAVAEGTHAMIRFDLSDDPVVMRLENRPDTNVRIFASSIRGKTSVFRLGGGLSEYPGEQQDASVRASSIHEQIRDAIKYSGVTLAGEQKETTSERIALLIEEAELSFFEMGFYAGLKPVCQVTAVVLASTARLFNSEPQTSVLLWRIANLILGRETYVLRLTPIESDFLQELSRQCDPGSPDELLFWLLERAIAQDKREMGQLQNQFKPL